MKFKDITQLKRHLLQQMYQYEQEQSDFKALDLSSCGNIWNHHEITDELKELYIELKENHPETFDRVVNFSRRCPDG